MTRWPRFVALLMLLAAAALVRAQPLQPVPPLTARVTDLTQTLAAGERAALEARLAAFEAEAGSQIAVLMVPTTAPEDIVSYTQRVGDAWKIGRRDVGDGLLIVVAKDDRRVRIAPAKALEGAVPDLAARQIIERRLVPAFRANDYAGGLAAAVDDLAARIRGEGLAPPDQRAGRGAGQAAVPWDALLIFFFVGVPIVGGLLKALLGRRLGTLATAGATGALAGWLGASLLLGAVAGLFALMLAGAMGVGGRRSIGGMPIIWGPGWGGGGGGWGGGGGFSSGGGGDFGGGGASGGW